MEWIKFEDKLPSDGCSILMYHEEWPEPVTGMYEHYIGEELWEDLYEWDHHRSRFLKWQGHKTVPTHWCRVTLPEDTLGDHIKISSE